MRIVKILTLSSIVSLALSAFAAAAESSARSESPNQYPALHWSAVIGTGAAAAAESSSAR
jgi:hypothetical protein